MSSPSNLTETVKDAAAALEQAAQAEEDAQQSNVVDGEPQQQIIEIDEELQNQAVDVFRNADQWFDPQLWGQISVILVILGIAFMVGRRLSERMDQKISQLDFKTTRKISLKVIRRLPRLIVPTVCAATFYLVAQTIRFSFGASPDMLFIASSLSFALLVVIFAVSFIKSRVLSRWVAKLAVIVTALHLLGWWDATMATLENIRFGLGANQISLYAVLKGLMYFAIFLWIARLLSTVFEKQIKAVDELTPSLKVLFSKLSKIFLIVIAILFGLNAIGFDLTTFAIFGGAIGVGLGFGLQKVVSNFISGIILLLDRSIKPGDVIAVDGPGGEQTFGWVNTLGARYVSIIRRDGKEHLIPNEIMITERVENWSFSNDDIRITIGIGIAYTADLHLARNLCLEAVADEPRIKEFPKPVCHVTEFGDNSVNLEIRGWINDPVNGIANVKSEVLVRVWDKFHEHNIEIPYPQRDLHLRTADMDVIEKIAGIMRGEKPAEDRNDKAPDGDDEEYHERAEPAERS